MFPNVRLLIAAVVASVVALSCGFAVFAVFRVNHEPLSRLAAGASPLQLAAGSPMPPAAIPAPANSFGNRLPPNNGDAPGASAQVTPPQSDDSVEASSAVATITTTAPENEPAEPAPSAPVAQAPAAEAVAQSPEPDATPSEVATTTPSEPAAPIEAPPAATDTAATAPPPEQPAPAAQSAATEQASQESNPPAETHIATTTTAEPPPPEAPHKKAVHRHRVAAKAQHARQARAIAPTVSQPAGIGGPFVPPPSRLVAKPPRPRPARATVQPVSQPSGFGGPFVPPATH
jgi:hypothetical protein